VKCLALVGPAAKSSLDPLLKALRIAQPDLRLAVIDALGAIGRDPQRVIPLLQQALKHQNPDYRQHAAEALGKFGRAAAAAGAPLTAALKDDSSTVRKSAQGALNAMKAAAAPAGAPAGAPNNPPPESILVPCTCGKRLRVKGSLAGRKVKCPACGGTVNVPLTADEADEKVCQVCLATVPKAAILCVHCGIDFRTGKPLAAGASAPRTI
jgi:hypothetical protein